MSDQQKEMIDFKGAFGFVCLVVGYVATCFTLPLRYGQGKGVLGSQTVGAVATMLVAFVCTRNPFFWWYLCGFLVVLVYRKLQSASMVRDGYRFHSAFNGIPYTIFLTRNMVRAKMWLDSLVCLGGGIAAGIAADSLREEWLVTLSSWLLTGSVCIFLDESLTEALFQKQLQARRDMEIESQTFCQRYEEER